MMRLLCWLPGLGAWRELCYEWRGRDSICNRVAPIETALRIAAAAGRHQTATQQISTVRARGGRDRRRAEATESVPRVPRACAAATALQRGAPTWSHYDIIRLALVYGQRHIVDQVPRAIDARPLALQREAAGRLQATADAAGQGEGLSRMQKRRREESRNM